MKTNRQQPQQINQADERELLRLRDEAIYHERAAAEAKGKMAAITHRLGLSVFDLRLVPIEAPQMPQPKAQPTSKEETK